MFHLSFKRHQSVHPSILSYLLLTTLFSFFLFSQHAFTEGSFLMTAEIGLNFYVLGIASRIVRPFSSRILQGRFT